MNADANLRLLAAAQLGKVKNRVLLFAVCRQRRNSTLRGYGEGRGDRSHGKGAGDFA